MSAFRRHLVLVFLILLLNDRRLVGSLANGPVNNLLAWLTAIVLAVLSAVLEGCWRFLVCK